MTTKRHDPSMVALLDCKAQWRRQLSKTTARSYGYCLHRLSNWLIGQRTSLLEAGRADLDTYIEHRLEQASATTVHVDWKAMRAFYRWAVEDDVLDADPSVKIKAPPQPKRTFHHVATEREVEALYAVIDANKDKRIRHRDAAMVALMFNGLRVGEVVTLRIEHVDLAGDVILLLDTKDGGYRRVGLDAESHTRLRRVLRDRGVDTGYVFTGRGENPMHPNGADQALRKHRRKAGLMHVNLHSLRAGLANQWLRAGKSQVGLMAHCGWADPRMPKRYMGDVAEDLAIAERHDMANQPALRVVS